MRIALLSYRSKPHGGGQGVYVRHLSRELAALGHTVEVFSGQPYPELDPGPSLTRIPSLDLYNDADPFRTPHPREIRDGIDVLEVVTMWTAGFPEPRTFSKRAARTLSSRLADFDVVHDNQCLGTGLLDLEKAGFPVVATVHHPITRDRELALKEAPLHKKITTWRWFGFLGMQKRVSRRLHEIITVSSNSAVDIATDFGVDPDRIVTIPLGVDTDRFHNRREREPGRLVCVASADQPLKGVPILLRALAKVREEHPGVRLTLVSKLKPKGEAAKLLDSLKLRDAVELVSGVDDDELAELVGSAEISVVPSMYEGFSLPAVEAMSSGCALIASRAGALPEVVGTDDIAARLVEPGDIDGLAHEISALLADPAERRRLSEGGRARVMERYSWAAVARRTAEVYEAAIARVRGERPPELTDGPVLGPDQAELDEHVTDDVSEVLPGGSGEYDIRKQEDAAC
ncbi:glycosyltransferase family 4 protein [Dietzia alimentaria]|uniref:glycosyltransferase family 4 protein n=1 Tax=Dietzia alimentaria TaxID=665550 RepID=UPI000299FA81|nr:glycosyltransferase family 4 protein [Dietzia alimentaria]